MLDQAAVQAIIFKALQNVNDERGPTEKIELTPTTRLFGANAALDSLALVSVIVDVEGGVSSASGRAISLTDDAAMSQKVSPFSDVTTLTNYILTLLAAP